MRKIIIWSMSFVMLCMMAFTCFATTDTLTLTDAAALPGDTVYLTAIFNESVKGSTMGVSYTYDSTILKPVPSACTWSKKGSLQDFGTQDSGVWTAANAVDLKGSVCILAFTVDENATFDQTEVSCQVIVKDGSKAVGTYTAKAAVSHACTHDYGAWEDKGTVGHSRTCTKCQGQQTQNHSWDEGKLSAKPNDSSVNVKTHTCNVCGGTKSVEIPASNVPTAPTVPKETSSQKETTVPTLSTAPTQGGTYPTQPTTLPTGPTTSLPTMTNPLPTVPATEEDREGANTHATVFTDYNSGNVYVDEQGNLVVESHDHSNEENIHEESDHIHSASTPISVEIDGETVEECTDPAHDHSADGSVTTQTPSYGSAIAVISVLVVAVAACVWYLKKKR